MLLKIRIAMVLSGLVFFVLEFWDTIMHYIKTEELVQPEFTWKFGVGALLFFLGIYLRKSKPGEKRYRDTTNMSDVDEGPDMDDD